MIISSIDIGTNTVLLLIADVEPVTKEIRTILNEYRIPRVGKGLLPKQPISSDKIQELFIILDEYKKIISEFRSKHIIATATNAFRIASNADEIVREIKTKFNIDVNIVAGKDEARLSFMGAVGDNSNNNKSMVIDIGGGSTEIIFGIDNKIIFNESYQIGVVSGTEKFLMNQPPLYEDIVKFRDYIKQTLNNVNGKAFSPERTIAIAGTPTTLACMKIGIDHYDEFAIEGSILKKDELLEFTQILSELTTDGIKTKYKSIVEGRADVLLAGTIILHLILDYFNVEEVLVSTKGIRYGAIVDIMQSLV